MTRDQGNAAARTARRPWVALLLGALVAGGAGGASAAFTATASSATSTFSTAAVSATGPAVSAVTVQRDATAGQTAPAGTFRQGAPYRVYAQLDPASPPSTVTAEATSFDGDATAAPLSSTGGPWTVGGTSYTHRSEELTANTGLRTGAAYPWSVTATDAVARSTTSPGTATAQTYASVLQATGGLVAHYPLSDGAVAADDLTGPAGSQLSGRVAPLGGTWTTRSGSAGAVLTASGRVRRAASGTVGVNTGTAPPTADYRVEADLHVRSLIAGDAAGVTAREYLGVAYLARFNAGQWELAKHSDVFGGVAQVIATAPATLTAGTVRRLGLQVQGSVIVVLVDGQPVIATTNTEIAGTGRGGVWFDGTTAPTDATGLHLDDVRVTTLTTTMAPRAGAPGTYHGGTAPNQPGALAGDIDGAARFDGVDDYGTTLRQVQDDLTVEFWYRSPGGTGAGSSWKDGAGLVDASVLGGARDFGTSLTADGRVRSGVSDGAGYLELDSGPRTAGEWHHVAVTRDRASGRTQLFVDGGQHHSGSGGLDRLDASSLLALGRLASGGHHYAGLLDEVALYSVVLSDATVADHHAAGRGTG